MNAQHIRTIIAASFFAVVLSACGGSVVDTSSAPLQTASAVATHDVDLSVDRTSVGQTPAPDCAADNCAGLRIIDGNAEAFRIDAMRRAAQENGA
jgi:hypothetical protein